VDKPALLYWLQILAYRQFGVNEFSARLPSALAAIVAVLLAYELGRRLFGPSAGLLAGLALGGSIAVCAAAHFANPDSLLNACTIAAFLFFWLNVERPQAIWFIGFGVSTGLAVLAKGPVGLMLPVVGTTLFTLLDGRRGLLIDRRQLLAVLAFVLVAVPWYAWVGAETKGEFLWGFFVKHNWERATQTMEKHSGSPLYYLPVLLVGFLPWSVFLGPAVWHSVRQWRHEPAEASRHLYLWCWVAVYFLPFSLERDQTAELHPAPVRPDRDSDGGGGWTRGGAGV
jgi:4-amino-4-deoxy-L-arabinose transferase-like glycosyltransferase